MEIIIRGNFTIETEDGFKINPRIIDLLKEVEKTGSLNAATKNLGMSYSNAWNIIFKINCQLNAPIVVTKRGGNGGGIAELTESGIRLLRYIEKLEEDFEQFLSQHTIDI